MTRPRLLTRIALIVAVVAALAALWPASLAGSALVVRQQILDPEVFVALGSHEWERLPAVARMARRSPRAVVLLTQPVTPTDDNCFRCRERVAWLGSLGVAAYRVTIMPRRVENTYDEAMAVAAYQRTRPFRRVVVVTSPYHTRRALAVFTAVMGTTAVVGVEPASDDSPARPERWWAAAYDRAYVPYEWTALVWYAWQYDVDPSVAPSRLVAATNRGGR